MNKFGPHFQRFTDEMKNLIVAWQPPLVVWVDPNQAGIDEIRHVSPGTFIVGRKNEEGHDWRPSVSERLAAHVRLLLSPSSRSTVDWDYQTSPEWWADECAAMGQPDAYLYNEPIGHDEKHLFAAFDEWQTRFRARLLERGIECVGLNVGTGNFTKLDNIAECFPRTCATFKHLGIHEYDWIIDPAKRPIDVESLGYYWGRWPYWLEYIGRDDVTLWITECGMTQAVHAGRPDEGWRSGADGMTDDDYVRWADWYNRQTVQDKRIGGAALFNFSGYGWETFEHLGWDRLGEILALDAEPPEIGGNDMIKVYDFDHSPFEQGAPYRDMDWLRSIFGDVQVHAVEDQTPLQPGELKLKVVWLDCRVGDTAAMIHVDDQYGNPKAGMVGVFGWPDADPHGLAADWNLWTGNGAVGVPTEANGDAGLGSYGKGAYYGPPGERGPHFIWLHTLPSDMVDGLGMLTMHPDVEGNHLHVNVGYQIVAHGEEPEPTPPPAGDLAAEVDAIADRLKEIAPLIKTGGNVTKLVAYYEDGGETTFVKETASGLVAKAVAKARALFG